MRQVSQRRSKIFIIGRVNRNPTQSVRIYQGLIMNRSRYEKPGMNIGSVIPGRKTVIQYNIGK